jgi:integral membrane protein
MPADAYAPHPMIRFFRFIALIEGLTTIGLFLIAMPLKYIWHNPALVPPLGMAHGVAFLAYIAVMLMTLPMRGFGMGGWLRTALAALIPFGTFLNDPYLHRRQLAHAQARAARLQAG